MHKTLIFLKFSILLVAMFAALVYVEKQAATSQTNTTQFSFLDIGQGDALLIRSRENRFILIDTGPGERILHALDRNWQQDQIIDVLVITHPDEDHAAGAIALLERGLVANIWAGANMRESSNKLWQLIEQAAGATNVPISYLTLGDQFLFGCCLLFNTVWPPIEPSNKGTNETSLSFLISDGDFDLLTLGDLGHTQELAVANYLEQNFTSLDLEVLKVSHHGSKTSTSKAFLERLDPELAIISAGRNNRYGHPAPDVISTLESENIEIYRTDLLGDIFLEVVDSLDAKLNVSYRGLANILRVE